MDYVKQVVYFSLYIHVWFRDKALLHFGVHSEGKGHIYFVLCKNVGMLAVDVDASNVFFNMNVAYT